MTLTTDRQSVQVVIVDYGLGNLFSVKHACEHAGMTAVITSSREEILRARAVILPGVGAFGDAMASLVRLDLVEPLRDVAAGGKPLMGICLGLQLLMTESHEFGRHEGLNIIAGQVVRIEDSTNTARTMKVPQVGWNRVLKPGQSGPDALEFGSSDDPWDGTLLEGIAHAEYQYFVHSFYARPRDPKVVLATTRYGSVEFCSAVMRDNVFATQFHPERSGPQGLRIYGNLARSLAING